MKRLGFGRSSIVVFAIGASCALGSYAVKIGDFAAIFLGVAAFLSIPSGLALAFAGAVKGEELVIGFALNSLWFLLPVLMLILHAIMRPTVF